MLSPNTITKNLFDILSKSGIPTTQDMRSKIEERVNDILTYEPRIGIFGKTGVGKSSLCNALFGQDICPVSDVEACTRDAKEVLLNVGTKGIKLIDVPGVGESEDRDKEYHKLYEELLPELDVVFWVLKGDDRAFASDERFYKNVVSPHLEQGKPMFFVLNQVDKIEPFREWDIEKRLPGINQQKNIEAKVEMVSKYFQVPTSKVVPVSAEEKYGLIRLVDEIVFALPKEKKITFTKGVNAENVSFDAKDEAKKGFIEVIDEFCERNIPLYRIGKHVLKDFFSGCFITSATCLSLGKGDSCYELNQFRKFRDEWLQYQVNGKEDIEEYYNIAPLIVNEINKDKNSNSIYTMIWDEYLSDCLKNIEDKSFNSARAIYTKMVSTLKNQWLVK